MRYIVYLFFLIPIFGTNKIQSIYYLYPVESCPSKSLVFLIEQKSKDDINLLLWNINNNSIEQGLWSLFNPVSVTLLPDETGFSFIDNGRLRIKYFNKRSPKTVEFDHYFESIHSVKWINSDEFYCSAKIADRYAIFYCAVDGRSLPLVSFCNHNCLYPQLIDSSLFYIERRDQDLLYCIRHAQARESISFEHTTFESNKIIIDFFDRPIIFLYMVSQMKGFVIEYQQNTNFDDSNYRFYFHEISKKEDFWDSSILFSYCIPKSFLLHDNDNSLYESLLPLIPRQIGQKIYFVDATKNSNGILQSYYYDITAKRRVAWNEDTTKSYFVPQAYLNSLILGGCVQSQKEILFFLT